MRSVSAEHIWKAYGGQAVLKDVTLQVTDEQITCVMAPSGWGKTTLLRIFLGLERPDRGAVHLPRGCRWSAVFQEDRLLEHLDAGANLRFVLGPDMEETRAVRLLAELGLDGTEKKRVREFSGGMRRRLALARALLAPFDALALDEPFTGLDRESRERCYDCIRRYAAGKPVLLVTHDGADAAALDARTVALRR